SGVGSRHADLGDLEQRARAELFLGNVVEKRIRDQLDDVAGGMEEVEGGGSAVALHDRRSLLDVGIAVELEQLVPAAEPRRRLLDRAARDVDREVVAGVLALSRRLEANRRTAQDDLDSRA